VSKFFNEPAEWRISRSVFEGSLAEMARDGAIGVEGVAMWLGHNDGTNAVIDHFAVLRGEGVRKGPALLLISSSLINELTDVAIENDGRLIGQIHAHGPGYGTDLSETDRRYGLAAPGMLSIVAPDYALRTQTGLEDCGVHLFRPGTGWIRLDGGQIARRFQFIEDDFKSPLIVEAGR